MNEDIIEKSLLRLYASTIARISEFVRVSKISRKGPSLLD